MTPRRPSLLLSLAAAACLAGGAAAQQATPLPHHHAPEPTVAAITPGDLMTRLYIFADDSMQGREAGTIGNVKGTDYIAAQVKALGLEPAGDDGTYFQAVPYESRALDTRSTVSVAGTPLRLGDEFLPVSRDPAHLEGLRVVYGGDVEGADSALTPDEARGRLVVLAAGPGTNPRRLRGVSVPGAAAVAVAGLDAVPAASRGFYLRPQGFLNDPAAMGEPGTPVILVSKVVAERMLSMSLGELEPGRTGALVDIDLRYDVKPMPYPSRNVVAILPGSDPKLKNEYVAIGAHNDHIGMTDAPVAHDSLKIWNHVVRPEGADDRGNQATPEQQAEVNRLLAAYRAAHPGPVRMDSISNGADDDGSGTVTVLEIAQKMASLSPRPKRSILFVWHVGEEKGLLGSEYFTNHPTVPRDSIVTQLNMDMVGRGDADDETGHTIDGTALHGDPDYLLLVGSRKLSDELGDLVERVNREDGHGLHFDYAFDAPNHPARIYYRSDHYEYARFGIPIVFFTTGLHSDYHQVTDEPQYIDYQHMARVGRFVEDVAEHVANLDHRPVVDHSTTDVNGSGR